jgi:hypothetical protein
MMHTYEEEENDDRKPAAAVLASITAGRSRSMLKRLNEGEFWSRKKGKLESEEHGTLKEKNISIKVEWCEEEASDTTPLLVGRCYHAACEKAVSVPESLFCTFHSRCQYCEPGSKEVCGKGVQKGYQFCMGHRCTHDGCKDERLDDMFCWTHGGRLVCESGDCDKEANPLSKFCKLHNDNGDSDESVFCSESEHVQRCVPLKSPIPSKFQGDMDKAKNAQVPEFTSLVNFSQKRSDNLADGMRCCVMCGDACSYSSRSQNKKGSGQDQVGDKGISCAAIIPGQNKGLCTNCDVNVWVVVQTDLEIKWCKGCKNFRPWAAFGEKGLATKCLRCREGQRVKYALQKEEKEKKLSTPKSKKVGGPRCKQPGCVLPALEGNHFCGDHRGHRGGMSCKHNGCDKLVLVVYRQVPTQMQVPQQFCSLHGGIGWCEHSGCHQYVQGSKFCLLHGSKF